MTLTPFIKWWDENAEKISAGPWFDGYGIRYGDLVYKSDYKFRKEQVIVDGYDMPGSGAGDSSHHFKNKTDKEFIVQSRNAMPDIVAALREAVKIMKAFTGGYTLSECDVDEGIACGAWLRKYFPVRES